MSTVIPGALATQKPQKSSTSKAVPGTLVLRDATGGFSLKPASVVDADISGSAAISLSKLAAGALPVAVTVASANIVDDTITNADINSAAAIDKTKISGTAITAADTGTVTSTMILNGTIVDADINASAGITHSKLATVTAGSVLLGNASNVATATALTGDVTVTSAGVTAIGSGVIVNDDINTSAAIAASKLATAAQESLVPAGAVLPFARSTAPSGWLPCDGSEYIKTGTYAALFAAISTSFGETNGSGGAGSSHFRVPDLRGIFVRGSDSQTISGTTYSGTFAAKQGDDVKPHNHDITDPGHSHSLPESYLSDSGGSRATTSGGTFVFRSVTNSATTGITINNSSGTETRPANIALLYCIKF